MLELLGLPCLKDGCHFKENYKESKGSHIWFVFFSKVPFRGLFLKRNTGQPVCLGGSA